MQSLLAARATPETLSPRDESDLIVALGPHLDGFVADAVRHRGGDRGAGGETLALDPIHACKRLFVQRQAVKKYPDPSGFDGAGTAARAGGPLRRAADRTRLRRRMSTRGKAGDPEALDVAMRYAAWATLTAGRPAPRIRGGTLFHVPQRIDPKHLVPVETIERDGVTMLRLPEHDWRHREGFALTDPA